jgi:hypothetical protein
MSRNKRQFRSLEMYSKIFPGEMTAGVSNWAGDGAGGIGFGVIEKLGFRNDEGWFKRSKSSLENIVPFGLSVRTGLGPRAGCEAEPVRLTPSAGDELEPRRFSS